MRIIFIKPDVSHLISFHSSATFSLSPLPACTTRQVFWSTTHKFYFPHCSLTYLIPLLSLLAGTECLTYHIHLPTPCQNGIFILLGASSVKCKLIPKFLGNVLINFYFLLSDFSLSLLVFQTWRMLSVSHDSPTGGVSLQGDELSMIRELEIN